MIMKHLECELYRVRCSRYVPLQEVQHLEAVVSSCPYKAHAISLLCVELYSLYQTA